MIFQSGGSSGGGGFSGRTTKPKSYGKSRKPTGLEREVVAAIVGRKMQNSSSNSNRMQAFPSVSKEAAKIPETSFAEGGPFSAQAVLNNSFFESDHRGRKQQHEQPVLDVCVQRRVQL